MEKVLFIIKRLKNFNFKAMFETAKKVSKKTNRLFIVILIDIIYCGIKYQAGYNDYLEFEFYLLDKKQRETYLTAGINNSIIKKYNKKEYWHILDDKIEFNEKFNKYLNRNWLDLRKASLEEFKTFLESNPIIMVKPIDECGGTGIEKVQLKDIQDVDQEYERLINNGQVLVEEYICQHEQMNKLYSGSVNTLRLFTINIEDAYYLQGVLRIGNGGNVDNFSSGGMYTFIDENGVVMAPAIDKEDNVYNEHPITGQKIIGFKIPDFEKAKQLVCKAAKEINEVGYIGWDVAVTEKGPALIEGNCYPGVFQLRPSFSENKEGILPSYLKYMEI